MPIYSQTYSSLFGAAMENGDYRTAKGMVERVEMTEGRSARRQELKSQFDFEVNKPVQLEQLAARQILREGVALR